MSDALPNVPENSDEPLQFDRAEFDNEASELSEQQICCQACKEPIVNQYFTVNATILCQRCRDLIAGHLTGSQGRFGRVVRATLLGGLGSIVGFVIYFAVMKYANLQIGLLSVLVGFLVGGGVRKGSNGRGGWFYQTLAILLTYFSLVLCYGSLVVSQMWNMEIPAKNGDQKAVAKAKQNPGAPKGDVASGDADERDDVEIRRQPRSFTVLEWVFLFVANAPFFLILPIRAGLESPLGLLIDGFALWEAWKINKRPILHFGGPYAVGVETLGEGDLEHV